MKAAKKKVFILMVGLALILKTGCAPTLVSISTPEIQTVENSYDEWSETFVDDLPVWIGEAKYDRYTILLFISWSSTDHDKKPEGMEK